jgi:hypothetical protein
MGPMKKSRRPAASACLGQSYGKLGGAQELPRRLVQNRQGRVIGPRA